MVIAWYNLEYHADVMGVVTTNSCNVTAQVHHGVHLPKNNMALSWYFQLLWSYIVFSLSLSLILSLKYDKTAFWTRAILLPWYWYFTYCCIEIPCYMNIFRFKNVLWWHHGTVVVYNHLGITVLRRMYKNTMFHVQQNVWKAVQKVPY